MKVENPDGYKGLKKREETIVKWRSEFETYAADIQHPKMREDMRYVHGDHWAAEDKAKMAETKRPMVVFNRVAALVDATYGAMIFNQMGISYVQRVATPAGGQISKHELLSSAAAYFRALPHWNAEAEDRDMFKDMLTCGIGAQEMIVDNEVTGDDEIVARRLDPFSVGWDTRAKRVGLMDRRWHFRKTRLSEDEFKDEFGSLPEGSQPGSRLMADTPGDKSEDPYEVYIFEWYETERFHRVTLLDADGLPAAPSFDAVPADLKGMTEGVHFEYDPPGDKTPRRRRAYWRAHVHGDSILRIRKLVCWAVTFATGKRDDTDGSWYGMVRNAKDPQDWANKFLSLVIYIIATSGKGIMAEDGVFPPDADFEKDWANPAKPSIVAAGAISGNRIAPKQQSALPPNLSDLLAFATSAVREVVGVSLETVAAQMNDQSGVVEESRKNAAMAVVAWAFASLRDFYRQQGHCLLKYMTSYIPQGRLIRTLGAAGEGQQFLPLTYEDAVYEVEVDEVPNSPNKKAESHRVLTAFAPILMQPDMPPPVKLQYVVEMLNSSSLSSDAVRRIEAAGNQPNPAAEQAQQIQLQTAMAQLQELAAKVEELQSQAELNRAKAQEIGGSVERRAIESAIDIDERQQTANLKLETAHEMAGIKREEAATKKDVAEHGLMMKLLTPPKQETSKSDGD